MGVPPLGHLGQDSCCEVGVARHHSAVEEAEQRPLILAGDRYRLFRSTHAVIEAHAAVPDRIPNPVGNLPHVAPSLVQEREIEIAARAELAPAVPADSHQSKTRPAGPHDIREHLRQPHVHGCHVGTRHVRRLKVAVEDSGDEVVA